MPSLFKAAGWLCIFCMSAFFGVPAQAAPLASLGLELSGFSLTPQDEALLGDMLKVRFVLKNTGNRPIRLDPGAGAFVAARWVSPRGQKRNRDFGYQHRGALIKPGQSITVTARKLLDSQGNWRIWPAFRTGGQWGELDAARKVIVVTARKLQIASGRGGGGATVVPWRGRKLPIQVLPPDNSWNQDISRLPKHPLSEAYIKSIGAGSHLHPDFGAGGRWNNHQPFGIGFQVVRKGQPKVAMEFRWASESDPGPYPVPPDYQLEKSGDRHILVLDYDAGKLYEVFAAAKTQKGWKGGSGAVFDLTSNKLRPLGWTSADAAGLPIFPGLARVEEIETLGEIPHALRFTVKRTQRGFIKPATHFASKSHDPRRPPMGLRVRLRADFDTSGFPRQARVILECLKKYGMILADNGGNWYISGAPSTRWDDNQLAFLKKIKGRDLEVVYTGEIMR